MNVNGIAPVLDAVGQYVLDFLLSAVDYFSHLFDIW